MAVRWLQAIAPDTVQLVNQHGVSRTRGVEALFRWRQTPYVVTASYLYLDAHEPNVDGPGNTTVPLTPRHSAGVYRVGVKLPTRNHVDNALRLAGSIDQPQAQGFCDSLGPVFDAELAKNRADELFDGTFRQPHIVGNHFVGITCHQPV